MIRIIKILWNKFNVAKELIAIIDGLQKENDFIKKQSIEFRTRAIAAEELVLKQEQWLRNSRQKPRPVDDCPIQ